MHTSNVRAVTECKYTVSEKTCHPFHFSSNFTEPWPIWIIFTLDNW